MYGKLSGKKGALYEQGILIFYYGKGNEIIVWEQVFMYTTQYYLQVRE